MALDKAAGTWPDPMAAPRVVAAIKGLTLKEFP